MVVWIAEKITKIIKLLSLAFLVILKPCYAENMQNIKNYNSFAQILFDYRDNNQIIDFDEAERLYNLATKIEDNGHREHSLDFLKSQLEVFGDNQAKLVFGYGSSIKPDYIIKATSQSKADFKNINVITNEYFGENKEKLFIYFTKAIEYYSQIVEESNNSNSKEKIILKELTLFLQYNENP